MMYWITAYFVFGFFVSVAFSLNDDGRIYSALINGLTFLVVWIIWPAMIIRRFL